MQMFAGTFAMCTEDPSIPTIEACKEAGNTWENPPGNSFDNFGSAMLALFLQVRSPLIAMDCHGLPFEHTCFAAPSSRSPHDLLTISSRSPHDLVQTSGDLWETEMFQAMAATGPGQAPVRNDYSPAALFTISWMFVGAFIALNLFIGAIVETFNSIAAETGAGSATMTGSQLQWVQTIKTAVLAKPMKGVPPPENSVRMYIFKVVMSVNFDIFIITIILLNTLLMACKSYQFEDDAFISISNFEMTKGDAYNYAMRFFITVYYTEFALKIFSLGPIGM